MGLALKLLYSQKERAMLQLRLPSNDSCEDTHIALITSCPVCLSACLPACLSVCLTDCLSVQACRGATGDLYGAGCQSRQGVI